MNMESSKISVYSARGTNLVGSWTKETVEKEIDEKDSFPHGEDEWIERSLSKAFAGEKGLDVKAVASVLKWSASGLSTGSVTFTRPSDGVAVTVLLT